MYIKPRPTTERLHTDVLLRDDYMCQVCGADASDFGNADKMRVGFIPRNDSSLTLTDADLKTLCPDCDDGLATAALFPRLSATELLKEIRRATAADQLAVRDWLLKKYPQRDGTTGDRPRLISAT